MRGVPWWAMLSSALAPVLLIGGWTLAAARQGPAFSSVRDTISALAGRAATDRWLMTAALFGLGLCHLVTAAGLRPAAPVGRLVLAVGGLATLAVATFPVPAVGTSAAHLAAAWVAFAALAVWPAFAWRSGAGAAALRPGFALVGAALLVGLALWLAVALFTDPQRLGLAERCAAGAQAVWPLVVVVSVAAA
ncbi:MAG: DUF998 domain-containing protein [Actinobacteria bacterium]|nr:MAG: DUF998 domain-containing protein [Actinomycetota bacterium]